MADSAPPFRLAAALCLGVAASAALPAGAETGRIFHYVRADADGGEVEHVHVFRAALDRLEVYKMREPCTNAALVTAEIEPGTGQLKQLTGGRLKADGTQQAFAFLGFDAATARLSIRAELPDGRMMLETQVGHSPWHLYDFDLASLSAFTEARADRRADFSFGLPLLLVGEAGPSLQDLGRADARFVGPETRNGRATLRFEVGGPAFGNRGGPLWLDAGQGHIVAAQWGIPNHDGYKAFRLELQGVSDGGRPAWDALLKAHHAGCKP